MRLRHLYLLIILAICGFFGCSSAPKISCHSANWYEFGRLDGIKGLRLDAFDNHAKNCVGEISPNAKTEYSNGRNRGLQTYCANGWQEGSSGRKYRPGVCHKNEKTFLRDYNPGLKLFQMRQRKIQISNRLKLQKLNQMQKHELKRETEMLDQEMVQISRRYDSIRKASSSTTSFN